MDIQYWITGYSLSRASPAAGPGLLSQNWFLLFPTVSEFIGYLLTKLTSVMTAGPYKTQRMMTNYVTTTQRRKRTVARAYGAIFTDDREKAVLLNSMYTSGFLIK